MSDGLMDDILGVAVVLVVAAFIYAGLRERE